MCLTNGGLIGVRYLIISIPIRFINICQQINTLIQIYSANHKSRRPYSHFCLYCNIANVIVRITAAKKVIICINAGIVTFLPLIDIATLSAFLPWSRVPVRAISPQTPLTIETKKISHAHIIKSFVSGAT